MNEYILEINQLSKRYSQIQDWALKNFSIQVKKGEILGILGPNGAGKTTLFSMLSGLLSPTSGSIEMNGLTLDKHIEKLKHVFGIVPQEIALYPSLCAYQNLMYVGRMYGIKKSVLHARITTHLERFQLLSKRTLPVENLSTGMRRSVNLMAGILHSPALLFLDEPAAGLDVQNRRQLIQYLKSLNATDKLTILYTSHDLTEAEYFCDRVIILDHGQALANGQPAMLCKTYGANNLEEVFLKITSQKSVRS